MKTLILSLSILFLAACGEEPFADVSCQGVLDGVEFTYTYSSVRNHWINTTCSNDDANSTAKEGASRFEGAGRGNNETVMNHCTMEADYIIHYTGGASATVKTNEAYTLQLREVVGEIPCQ